MKIAFVHNLQKNNILEEAEFDPIEVVTAIKTALENQQQNQVELVELTRDGSWIDQLKKCRPDIIFNTAEGFAGIGRESFAPICFEQLGIPYVGSGPYCCFLTLDKFLTKQVVFAKKVPVVEGLFTTNIKDLHVVAKELAYPVFVKPNFEGSSKGITPRSLCHNFEELVAYASEALRLFPDGILIERFIEGKDITVPYIATLGKNGVLDPIEYVYPLGNKNEIYDFELKNRNEKNVKVQTANLPPNLKRDLIKYTEVVVKALAVQDMARADFRVTSSGDIYFLELNPLPSLQPDAGMFYATSLVGMNYQQTILKILEVGQRRLKLNKKSLRSSRKIKITTPEIALVYNLKRKKPTEQDYASEAEYDSIETVTAISDAIKSNGYHVSLIEADKDLANHLMEKNIDIVFNIAEGANKRTREAQVPAICDLLGIEHTGSDATSLSITLDKYLTTKMMKAEGIRVPESFLIDRYSDQMKIKHHGKFPMIVKPNTEGTSKGVWESSVVHSEKELKDAIKNLWGQNSYSILCEEYIQGREFTVGMVGNNNLKILGPMEIKFKNRTQFPVYSFESKQAENQFDNEFFSLVCPADIDQKITQKIHKFAKDCFKIAGCRDVARIDFRLTKEEEIVFIEINPLPGLTPSFSDLTIMADKQGLSYQLLISQILRPAVMRWRKKSIQNT